MTTITALTDNSGSVYLSNNGQIWAFGPVTEDLKGRFAELAAEWASGEWAPNEGDGQTPATADGLEVLATWTGGAVTAVAGESAAATFVGTAVEAIYVSICEGDQERGCQAVRGAEVALPAEVITWAEENGATIDEPDLYLLVETQNISGQLQGVVAETTFTVPVELADAIREIAAEEAAQD